MNRYVKKGTPIAAVFLAAALFCILIRRAGGTGAIAGTLSVAGNHLPLLLLGISFFSISLLCGILRWKFLLSVLGLPLGFMDCVRLYAVGHFFNMLGPGALGGDVVKAACVAGKCPGSRTEAVTSIAAERLIGMLGMTIFVSVICLFSGSFFEGDRLLIAVRHGIFIGASVMFAFLILLSVVNWEGLAARVSAPENSLRGKILSHFVRAWRTLRICLTHPVAAAVPLALSLLNHFVDVCCYFILSRCIDMGVRFRDLLVISPIANTIAAVPLTPGGAGIRENVLLSLLGTVGISERMAAALGLLMFMTLIIWALVGGLITCIWLKDIWGGLYDGKNCKNA